MMHEPKLIRLCEIGASGARRLPAEFNSHARNPEDQFLALEKKEIIWRVLTTLTNREIRVIGLRFGLYDVNEHTLEEIGRYFAVHKERIRQIEAKALCKLRHRSRSDALRGLINAQVS
jgi:RNA polymerase primary sigma factor